MVDPLWKTMLKMGIVVEPQTLMEPLELQPRLTQETLLEIYVQTLQDMGTHNEAIDRITGKWQELHERRRTIAAAKVQHAQRISDAQAAGKALRRQRRRHAALKRIKLLRNSAKPKLP
jgi:hypothetical protein